MSERKCWSWSSFIGLWPKNQVANRSVKGTIRNKNKMLIQMKEDGQTLHQQFPCTTYYIRLLQSFEVFINKCFWVVFLFVCCFVFFNSASSQESKQERQSVSNLGDLLEIKASFETFTHERDDMFSFVIWAKWTVSQGTSSCPSCCSGSKESTRLQKEAVAQNHPGSHTRQSVPSEPLWQTNTGMKALKWPIVTARIHFCLKLTFATTSRKYKQCSVWEYVDDHAAMRAPLLYRTDWLRRPCWAKGLHGRSWWTVGGHWWDGGGRCFSSRSPGGGLVKHMARWRVVGGRVPCWLMVAEMSDNSSVEPGVNLLGKHSEDQSDASWDMEKSNQSLEVDFSYPPLSSTPGTDPMLSSKYL